MTRLAVTAAAVLLLTGAAAERADPAPERCAYPKVARTIDQYLAHRGSPAAGQGCLIATEAIREDWHPAFVVAVAGKESSYWVNACRSNPKNGWGLSSCGDGWHVPYFHTWRQAVRFFVAYLSRRFAHAATPFDFNRYAASCNPRCTPSSDWPVAVTLHMRLIGYGPSVRWPW